MLDLKIMISITINALKFLKYIPQKLNFPQKMLLCNTEDKQEVSDFSLPDYGSALKKMCET
jgi:hypothetical protein